MNTADKTFVFILGCAAFVTGELVGYNIGKTVTNCGTATLVISSTTPTGNFGRSTTCGTLLVGQNCVINVTFSPLSAGALTGSISIASNAALIKRKVVYCNPMQKSSEPGYYVCQPVNREKK